MKEGEILVVGAGPTGLTMAIEARRLGLPVRLIDKSDQAAQHSQALGVQARTLEQFERYGISETAVQRGRKLFRASVISGDKTILTFSFDRIPGRYPFVLFLPQNETEAILGDQLKALGGVIERGTEFLSMEDGPEGVAVRLRHANGSLEEAHARWLIGCDGTHSTVREGVKTEFIGDDVGLGFFLGDLELRGAVVPADELRVYLHEGDVVFIGRLTESTHRVIVALHSERGAADSKKQLTLDDFQSALDRCVGKGTIVSSPVWMTRFYIHQRKAKQYRIGNVFLAGDACHVHSPVAGQGMNTGIQDVANLAWKLAAVANGADAELLDSYDEERGAVGKALLRKTSFGLSVGTAANPWVEELRDAIISFAARFPWVQKTLLGFLSETAIHYRGSSIVKDCGGSGSLCAGDRVPNPDLRFQDGHVESLLEPLKSGAHLLLAVDVEDPEEIRKMLPEAQMTEVTRNGAKAESKGVLDADQSRLFGGKGSILVIRPDGYVGFRGDVRDMTELESYGRMTGISAHAWVAGDARGDW